MAKTEQDRKSKNAENRQLSRNWRCRSRQAAHWPRPNLEAASADPRPRVLTGADKRRINRASIVVQRVVMERPGVRRSGTPQRDADSVVPPNQTSRRRPSLYRSRVRASDR